MKQRRTREEFLQSQKETLERLRADIKALKVPLNVLRNKDTVENKRRDSYLSVLITKAWRYAHIIRRIKESSI